MSARDAQRVLVAAHDGAPGLGAFKDRDPPAARLGDLGIVVVYGGGADNEVHVAHVGRCVADGYLDAQGAQMLHGGALTHIRSGDAHTHTGENLGQRRHGDAADAHQMCPPTGDNIVVDVV